MNFEALKWEAEQGVCVIEIDRPKALNALNRQVLADLKTALEAFHGDESLHIVVLTGGGAKAFVAGADIKEFQKFNQSEALSLSREGKLKLFNKLANFQKPIIAAINGFALGGGLELALSCHIRIASFNAKMGLPECSLGLIPGYGGAQRLTQLIGRGKAMEMILGSKIINSKEALDLGLINRSVELEILIPEALSLAKTFLKNPPEALSAAIKAINHSYSIDAQEIESIEFSHLFKTANFKEGVVAFLEKRKPKFR